MPNRSDDDYISADPFSGDEAELTCRYVAIRTAAKEHTCYGLTGLQDHTIKRGERYRYEKALVDGDFWGTYRICLKCMDEWIAETNGSDDDDDATIAPEEARFSQPTPQELEDLGQQRLFQ